MTLSCQTPPTTHCNLLLTRSPSPLNPQPPKSLHLEKCVAAVHRRSFGSTGSADPPRNSLEVTAESCRRESEETTGRKSNQPGHNASISSEVSFIGIVDHWSYQRKKTKNNCNDSNCSSGYNPNSVRCLPYIYLNNKMVKYSHLFSLR